MILILIFFIHTKFNKNMQCMSHGQPLQITYLEEQLTRYSLKERQTNTAKQTKL